jgi:hypothetical protein
MGEVVLMLVLLRDKLGCPVVMLLSLALLGCGPAAMDVPSPDQSPSHDQAHDHEGHDHDSHDHDQDGHAEDQTQPADFSAAVAAVHEDYEAIRDAFQANDMEKAHEPMHRIGRLIETLPEFAAKAELGEQELATVKSAAAAMFEAYGEIDDAIHTGKQADYAAASGTLDKAMTDLQAVLEDSQDEASE